MIKVIEIINHRSDLSIEDFQDYWLNSHGPIVSRLPGLRRYVQSHTKLGGYRRGPVAFDGIAELWFDDKEALARMATTPEFSAAKADEPNFIDSDTLVELVVDEHVIKDGSVPPAGIKNVEFVNLLATMTPEDAHRYWRDVHGPIAAQIPTMQRYVQSHTRSGAYARATAPPFDGVAITWWEDLDAMRASADSQEYLATRADEANFIEGEPQVILTTEHVLV